MNTIELYANKLKWELLFLQFKLFGKKISLKKYYDKPVLAADEGNKCIRELLLADEPAAIFNSRMHEIRDVGEKKNFFQNYEFNVQ